MKLIFSVFVLAIFLLFSGCSTLSQEEVFNEIKKETSVKQNSDLIWIKNHSDEEAIHEKVELLLKEPLIQDNAVRIALINNRALQQVYEEVGISHSDLVQAGLMSNPLLGYSVGRGGGKTTTTLSLDMAFLDLLWIPLRRELGTISLEQTKYRVGDEVLRMARDTKKAYYEAKIAGEQVVLYRGLLQSYEVSLQLAVRQYTAGNLSKRDYLKMQEIYAHARVEAIRSNHANATAREALNRLLGLSGKQTDYMIDTQKTNLPTTFLEEKGLERQAILQRLDMAAIMKEVDYAAADAGFTQKTRFLNEAEISLESEKSTDEKRFNTFGIKVPIPIFDIGQGRLGMAQARYNQSLHHLYETAVNIRSQVREGYAAYRYTYDIAKEYDERIIKTNQQILEQTQLFYNGMLDGIYELLEDQRKTVEAKIEGLQAIGEYQKALADLEYTTGGKL